MAGREGLLADAYAKLDAPSTSVAGLKGAFYQPATKGRATLRTFTGGGIKDLLDTDGWTILSAAKKGLPAEENAARNRALFEHMTNAGYQVFRTLGKYGEKEDSFAIVGVSEQEARDIGTAYEQEAVLTRSGFIYEDGSVDPARGITVHETPPEDFYTTLPDGTTFTIDIDFRKPEDRAMFTPEARQAGDAPTTQELRPAVVFGTDLSGDGRQFTKFFEAATKGQRKPIRAYEPLLDVTDEAEFSEEYKNHRGEFDAHIAASIPGFPEVQVAVGGALLRTYGDGADVLDIGASEGSFIKTLSALSDGKIRTVGVDPNVEMKATFDRTSQIEGATYDLSALGTKEQEGQPAWKEEDGTEIAFYKPDRLFDVFHESMVFQFISNGRNAQFRRVKEFLKPGGLALFEEKIFEDSADYRAAERKKDAYKATYFPAEDLKAKDKEV